MNSTPIVVEQLVAGVLLASCSVVPLAIRWGAVPDIFDLSAAAIASLAIVALLGLYVLGVIGDRWADIVVGGFRHRLTWAAKEGKPWARAIVNKIRRRFWKLSGSDQHRIQLLAREGVLSAHVLYLRTIVRMGRSAAVFLAPAALFNGWAFGSAWVALLLAAAWFAALVALVAITGEYDETLRTASRTP